MGKKEYEVFYMQFPIDIDPILEGENATHVRIPVTLEADSLNEVYEQMQGENWSPNGEAFDLIRSLGLEHTSLTVGDVVVDMNDDHAWMCENNGWRCIW